MLRVSYLLGLLGLQTVTANQHRYPQTALCCDKIDSESDLMSCIERVDHGTKDIAIISYASADIMDYAAYAFGVNSAYAEQNGYEMYFLNEAGGANYEPRDPRWNRVKILEEALQADDGWLNTVEYVVWMDSDLIVLDMDFDIRKIIAANSESDIIISSERHAETGVANTGCFIMKNSAWSRAFLHEWWVNYDRSEAHDQIFFDKLYKSKLPDITKHVAILPTDEINSTPPPMLWQTEHNQVLHMMDSPDMLRKAVFEVAFDELCEAYVEQRPLAPQLGVTKEVLMEKADAFYVHEIRELFPILNSEEFDLELFYESASICLYDFTRLVDLGVNVAVDIAGFNTLINERIEKLRNMTKPDLKSIVAMYNLAVPYAELFFNVLTEKSQQLEILNRVTIYLNIMVSLLHASAKHIAFNMQVKHFTIKGDFWQSVHECSRAEASYQKALTIFEDMGDNADQWLLVALNEGFATVSNCTQVVVEEPKGETQTEQTETNVEGASMQQKTEKKGQEGKKKMKKRRKVTPQESK